MIQTLRYSTALFVLIAALAAPTAASAASECLHKPLELSLDGVNRAGRSAVYTVTVFNPDSNECGPRSVRPSILPDSAVTGFAWPSVSRVPAGGSLNIYVKLAWQGQVAPDGQVRLGLFDRSYLPASVPAVIAHRGASASLPEDTERAINIGSRAARDGVEFDVRSTKDLSQVLMHDLTLDRATSGTGLVSETTDSALSGVTVDITGGNEMVPTIDDAIAASAASRNYIDIKYGASLTRILSAIQGGSPNNSSVSSSNWYNLDWFRKRAPNVNRIFVWFGGSSTRLTESLNRSATNTIMVPASIGTASFIGAQHRSGRRVLVVSGGLSGPGLQDLLAVDGVAGVVSDYPARAKYLRDEWFVPEVGSLPITHGEGDFGAADKARLSLWSSKSSATYGWWPAASNSWMKLAGYLVDSKGARLANVRVTIEVRGNDGEWFWVNRVVTNDQGYYQHWFQPYIGGRYRATSVAGDTSNEVVVDLAYRADIGVTPWDIRLGQRVNVNGWVKPWHDSGTVYIQWKTSRTSDWRYLATTNIDSSSHFSLGFTPPAKGNLMFRAHIRGHGDHSDAYTPVRTVRVR